MGVQIILVSVVIAHMCTATIDDDYRETYEWDQMPGLENNNTSTDDYGGTYERDLKSRPANSNSLKNKTVHLGLFHVIINHLIAKETGNYTPYQAKINSSSLAISEEAVLFLKGLMVTRIMPSLYIFIILISLPLNALALVTFTCKIREKKPAVIYMSHLACADLLFTLLLPLKIHYQLNAVWVFGEVACRVVSAAYYCYMYCSILLMMCMSVDRLLAVAFPITSLNWRSARKAKWVCVLVWLLAIAGTVPILSMRQTIEIRDVGITCHDALLNNDPSFLYYVYLFSILSCLYFFFPLVVTLVSYFTIIYVLSAKSDRLTTSSSSSDHRRKAVIMAIAVLVEFVVCFAPTNGILLYHCVRLATRGEGDSSYVAYLLVVCLGSASVFLDPLLYYFGSSQCRQQIKSVLRREKAKKPISPSNTKCTADTKTRVAAEIGTQVNDSDSSRTRVTF